MTRKLSFFVPEDRNGITVKEFARRCLMISAGTLTQQKKLENGITKNGVPCKSNEIIHGGDRIDFLLPEEELPDFEAVEREIDVLWEDENFLALNKPASMPIYPTPGHDRDSLLNAVVCYFKSTDTKCRFRPLYRLDKDTTGIILLAKNRPAAFNVQIKKEYYAVCEGILKGSGTVDAPIGLAKNSKIRREAGHGDNAVTHWESLEYGKNHTLLKLILDTGRTHQIRVHLAFLGHPLAGDDFYGGKTDRLKRQALHCGRLRLSSALFDMSRDITCPVPQDIRSAFPELIKEKTI